MSNMKYATPLEYTDLQEYRETRDLPKEKRAEIEGIAKGLDDGTLKRVSSIPEPPAVSKNPKTLEPSLF